MSRQVEFQILGPVEIRVRGTPLANPAGRRQVLLAALLARANSWVPVEELLDRLWGQHPPNRARKTVQSYVRRLRVALDAGGLSHRLRSSAGGYYLDVRPGELDLDEFQSLLDRAAQSELGELGGREALDLLCRALELWRGAPFSGIPSESLQRDVVPKLEESRIGAIERRFELELEFDNAEEILGDLREQATLSFFNERLAGQLMRALFASGRQAEALEHYGQLSRTLADELGIDPGYALQDLHLRMLRSDPDLAAPASQTHRERSATVCPPTVPHQLPAGGGRFIGRETELAELRHLVLPDGAAPGRPPAVLVIDGPAGAGKTEFALRFAREIGGSFAGGELFMDLRGFAPDGPVPPASALVTLLVDLGVPPDRIPDELDARSKLLRSELVRQEILIVLDNALDVHQVRPLLPGNRGVVLVTSRSRLRGLTVRDGAHRVPVAALPAADASELFTALIGVERAGAEPDAVRRIVSLCDGLPLALSVVADRATFGGRTLTELGDALEDPDTRLAMLDMPGDAGGSLRDMLSRSLHVLQPEAATLFRLLGRRSRPEVSVREAATLAGVSPASARTLLAALDDLHLVESTGGDGYRIPGLIELYARESALRSVHSPGTT